MSSSRTRCRRSINDEANRTNPMKPKRKYRKSPKTVGTKRGRWEKWECETFLRGFRIYGKGKWKEIARMIPSRTTIQVKTHAQMVLKRMETGEDVFKSLDLNSQAADSNDYDESSHKFEDDVTRDTISTGYEDSIEVSSEDQLSNRRCQIKINVPHSIIAPSPIQTSSSSSMPPICDEDFDLIAKDFHAAQILVTLGSTKEDPSDDLIEDEMPTNFTAV